MKDEIIYSKTGSVKKKFRQNNSNDIHQTVWDKTQWFLQRKVNEKCEEAERLIFRPNI